MASLAPLSVIRGEDVTDVAAPADGIATVAMAVVGIVAEPTFVDEFAVSDDAVAAGVTAEVAAAAADAAASGCCSLSRGAGPGDGDRERRNCRKGAFSRVLKFLLRLGILVEREAMCEQ
jgi:hypothetical protein